MPNPTPGDQHVDRLLTTVSTGYFQDPGKFIADRVFAQIPVNFKSDKMAKFDKQPWMRTDVRARALSTESAGGGYTVGSQTYTAEVYAIHKDIDDQVRANAEAPFAPDRDATAWVVNQLRLFREIAFMTAYFGTSIWDAEWGGVASDSPTWASNEFERWDREGSTPVNDVIRVCTYIEKITSFRPNVAVIQREVYDSLKTNKDILDRVRYTSAQSIDTAILARLWEVDEVMVASAVYDSAEEGADASQSFIGGKHVLLAYRTPTPSLQMPSAGYIPVWTGYLGAGAYGNRMKKFRMEHLNSDRVEGELAYDMMVSCSDCGVFLSDCIS
jgi:hypothetical protein